MALIVCVNETATFPRLMFVKRLPMVWTIARGRIARSWETRTKLMSFWCTMCVLKVCTEKLNIHLGTRNLWSFKDTSDPHEQSNGSSNSKLHSCDVYRVRQNLQNLPSIETVLKHVLVTSSWCSPCKCFSHNSKVGRCTPTNWTTVIYQNSLKFLFSYKAWFSSVNKALTASQEDIWVNVETTDHISTRSQGSCHSREAILIY